MTQCNYINKDGVRCRRKSCLCGCCIQHFREQNDSKKNKIKFQKNKAVMEIIESFKTRKQKLWRNI